MNFQKLLIFWFLRKRRKKKLNFNLTFNEIEDIGNEIRDSFNMWIDYINITENEQITFLQNFDMRPRNEELDSRITMMSTPHSDSNWIYECYKDGLFNGKKHYEKKLLDGDKYDS